MPVPITAPYVEPSNRTLVVDWTPNRIRQAELLADSGNLLLAADLCDAMLADDAVQAVLDNRIRALLGCDLEFEAGQGRRKHQAVNALAAQEDFYEAFPEDALTEVLRWALLLNVAPARLPWVERDEVNRVIPRLESWHPRNLRCDMQRRRWRVRVNDGAQEVDFTPGDGTWMLHTPRGKSRPWMIGAWRAVSRWWLLKHYAKLDWGRYSDRQGQGLFVGSAPENVKKESRLALAKDLQQLGRTAGIALPPGYDLKLVESVARTWETFQAQIDAADKGITVALTSLNLTNEDGGSYAKAESLGGIRTEVLAADGASLATTLHDQALVYWAEFNYGSTKLAPWPKWKTEKPEDRKACADINKTRADTAVSLSSIGIFTVDEVRVLAGYEPLGPEKGGNDIVKPPTAEGAAALAAPPTQAPAQASAAIRLRSGRTVAAKSGLVQGQLYADALADNARERAAKVLDPDVVAVLEAIEAGESYTDIRERLTKTFKGMRPHDLARLFEATLVMAEFGGRHAINEDLDDG